MQWRGKKNWQNCLTQSIFVVLQSLQNTVMSIVEPQVEHIAHYAVNIGRDVSSAPATLYQPSTPKDTRKQSRAPYTDARRARLNVVQRMERPLLLSWVASTSTVNLSNPFLPLLLSGRGERKTFLPFFHPKLLRVRFFFFFSNTDFIKSAHFSCRFSKAI